MGRFDHDHRFRAVGSYHITSYDNLFLSIDLMLKASLHHASTRALRHSNLTDHSMNRADYLLPPLPGCDDLKHPTINNSTQSNDTSTDDKPPTPYDRYSEVYKGYDAYHSQIRKLDWLKAHRALTTSPEVTPHTTWLIETLQAIITRWEAVLPYIASPYPIPPNNPSAFT
ncbi:hypothetical protein J4E90_006927 [Alternaria incomplexa]|uniref:uncharacterized protein n=1 Tax=Alternaria incomplexa TaxID=1187928 RepID=UPI00221EA758|nr:uncharacterized protein J4E90_006927 [Alternaria incomplexa]KAI4910672.1 hypothetical protein J4E90_006927 [Alternaria incomplexa]